MMTPFVVTAKRVLVVTPSRMVADQIVEDFSQLKTLNKATVVNRNFSKPVVYEMKHLFNDEIINSVRRSDVIVATPACALSLTENIETKQLIDMVLIDEAHHVPAKTWEQIFINMEHAKQIGSMSIVWTKI